MPINTSGTFDFNPALGSLVLDAFGMCGVRPAEITTQHLSRAQNAANYTLVELSNLQPNLWEVGLQTVPLLQAVQTYTVPAETVTVLDAYISYGSPTTDRIINPISRSEWAALPNKTQQGFPNQFWFDRLVNAVINLWPVPDGNGPYVLKYYSVRQTQDAVLKNGLTVEIPYRFLEAYVNGVAWRLSKFYAPQSKADLFADYSRSLDIADTQDTEAAPLSIVPGTSGYWRP